MQNGHVRDRRPQRVGSLSARSNAPKIIAARPITNDIQGARRSYERYLALAQEQARGSNVVEAENYYQHAEHFFRVMSANRAS
jgi:Domain of unknown function (DUF4167)